MRIAVDIDGVLTEPLASLARAANERFDTDFPETVFVDSAGYGVTEEIREWVYSDDGPASRLMPAHGARDFLAALLQLVGEGNVHVITARPVISKVMTDSWFDRHGLSGCEVVFDPHKVTEAQSLGVEVAVEDSLRHASDYAAAGIIPILLTLEENGQLDAAIRQVPDLDAALKEIERIVSETAPSGDRPKIVVSDVIDQKAREVLAERGSIVDVDGTDVRALFEAVEDADALVVRSETQVTAELMANAPRLQVVARAGVGIDNVDVDAATEAGVIVLNAPGANRYSAGEHTIALMLSVARQLPIANASMHAGKWERKKFKLFDLRDKTVGIVGLGRVGRVVAQRLKAFGCHVIAHDPYVSAEIFRENEIERVSYPELLATSDIVTYHVPLTEETYHYLSADAIRQLKSGAVVINAARGEVVDHEALAEALDSGRIAGAGVDVFPEEPLLSSPLWGRPNVVLTPHLGGSSDEALAAVGQMISHSVLAALNGEAVPNAVNLPAAQIEPAASRKIGRAASAAGHLLSVLEPEAPASFAMTARGNLSDEVYELVFSAALAAALEQWSDSRVSPVNARMIASELKIEQHLSRYNTAEGEDVQFEFEVRNDDTHHVTIRWAGNDVGIYEVDRFSLGHPLAGDVLITHHRDVPGVVGRVGSILGRHGVNIAGMQLGRHAIGGEALMVLNVDDAIDDAVLNEIKTTLNIDNAYVVSLPGTENP